MRVSTWIMVFAVVMVQSEASIASVDLSEGQEQIISGLIVNNRFHNDNLSLKSLVSGLVFPRLPDSEVVKAIQGRYHLTHSEVAVVLNALLFGERQYSQGVPGRSVVGLLCQPNYVNSDFLKYLESKMAKGDLNWVSTYLLATDYDFAAAPVRKIFENLKTYNYTQRCKLFEDLGVAYMRANHKDRKKMLFSFASFLQREALKIGDSDSSATTLEMKSNLLQLDKFLKLYPGWVNTDERLKVLELLSNNQKQSPVSSVDGKISAELVALKRHLSVRRLISRVTFGLVSPRYVLGVDNWSIFRMAVLFAFLCLIFIGMRRFLNQRQKVERVAKLQYEKIQSGQSLESERLGEKKVDLPKRERLKKQGLSRLSFWIGLTATGFVVGLLPTVYKYSVYLSYAGLFDEKGVILVQKGVVVALVLIVINLCFLTILRLRNAGMNSWYVILLFVPIVGILVLIWCLSSQKEYEKSKRLDLFGKCVVITSYLCMLIPFIMLFFKMTCSSSSSVKVYPVPPSKQISHGK